MSTEVKPFGDATVAKAGVIEGGRPFWRSNLGEVELVTGYRHAKMHEGQWNMVEKYGCGTYGVDLFDNRSDAVAKAMDFIHNEMSSLMRRMQQITVTA